MGRAVLRRSHKIDRFANALYPRVRKDRARCRGEPRGGEPTAALAIYLAGIGGGIASSARLGKKKHTHNKKTQRNKKKTKKRIGKRCSRRGAGGGGCTAE